MLHVTTKNILCCSISFFMHALCMENGVLQVLPKEVVQIIAGQLTFVERHYLKNSFKLFCRAFKDDALFLSPFDAKNYRCLMYHPQNRLSLGQLFSPIVRLKLKVYYARQKDRVTWLDLIRRETDQEYNDRREVLHYNDMQLYLENSMNAYKTEWKWNDHGNEHHHEELMSAIKKNCRPMVDLLLVQGIDINAVNQEGCTVLHETCKKDGYAWATEKLIRSKKCNLKSVAHDGYTPLDYAWEYSNENLKVFCGSNRFKELM